MMRVISGYVPDIFCVTFPVIIWYRPGSASETALRGENHQGTRDMDVIKLAEDLRKNHSMTRHKATGVIAHCSQ